MLSNTEVIAGYFENHYDKDCQDEIQRRLDREEKYNGYQFAIELCLYQFAHQGNGMVPWDIRMRPYYYARRIYNQSRPPGTPEAPGGSAYFDGRWWH
jgi:hypothetical protein